MTDKLTKERRSWNMSRIKGKDTGPEKAVRSLLHRLGYRFRLHRKDLPGRPDVVLPKYRTVIFVHGCFWHSHGCKDSGIPKTNQDFWQEKLGMNKLRDEKNRLKLQELGWKVLVVWECELKDLKILATSLREFLADN